MVSAMEQGTGDGVARISDVMKANTPRGPTTLIIGEQLFSGSRNVVPVRALAGDMACGAAAIAGRRLGHTSYPWRSGPLVVQSVIGEALESDLYIPQLQLLFLRGDKQRLRMAL